MGDVTNFKNTIDKVIEQIESKDAKIQLQGLNLLARSLATKKVDLIKAYKMLSSLSKAVPYLIELLRGDSTYEIKSYILGLTKRFEIYPEFYDALVFLFKQYNEEDSLSFGAGKRLKIFEEHLEETQEIYFEALHSENKYAKKIAMNLITDLTSMHTTNPNIINPQNWRNIFLQIVKEDKDKEFRNLAWSYLKGSSKINVDALLDDVLKASLYDTLNQFQPDIQVTLPRIIELTGIDPYNRMTEIVDSVTSSHIQITKEQFERAIKELLADNLVTGEYFDMEQVFVRKKSKGTPIKPLTFSKKYICYNCGNPLEHDTKVCPSCNQDVLKCSVCKLPINFGQEIGKCTYCETPNHLDHLHEWVKTKGKCPTCQKNLKQEEVVPTTAFEVKK